MSNVIIRPLRAGEEQLFLSMPDPAPIGHRDRYETYAPQHTWVALRGDRVVARAAWAVKPGTEQIVGTDWFDLDDVEVGAELLNAAHARLRDLYGRVPEYHLYLKPGWRDRPDEAAAVERRVAAARLSGLEVAGERLRHVWTAVNPLPEPPGRFTLSPASVEEIGGFPPPAVLTGVELAFADGVRLADNPLHGLGNPHIVRAGDAAIAIAGGYGDHGRLALMSVRDEAACLDLVIGVTAHLEAQGSVEIYADTENGRPAVLEALAEVGYRQIRARLYLGPQVASNM